MKSPDGCACGSCEVSGPAAGGLELVGFGGEPQAVDGAAAGAVGGPGAAAVFVDEPADEWEAEAVAGAPAGGWAVGAGAAVCDQDFDAAWAAEADGADDDLDGLAEAAADGVLDEVLDGLTEHGGVGAEVDWPVGALDVDVAAGGEADGLGGGLGDLDGVDSVEGVVAVVGYSVEHHGFELLEVVEFLGKHVDEPVDVVGAVGGVGGVADFDGFAEHAERGEAAAEFVREGDRLVAALLRLGGCCGWQGHAWCA